MKFRIQNSKFKITTQKSKPFKPFKFLLVFLTSHFLLLPLPVKAHVLKTDSSIGAVIHISPEDDPIAGEQADFFFEFKDRQGKFTPQGCDCTASIVTGGKEIYSQPLFQNSDNPSLEDATFSYTFPERNIYKVKVSGKPTEGNVFEPFTLEWDIRVERVVSSKKNNVSQQSGFIDWTSRHIPHLTGALVIAGFAGYIIVKDRMKRR